VGILKKFFILLIITFSFGELTRIQFPNSVAITLNDIVVFIFVGVWLIFKLVGKRRFNKPSLLFPILIFFLVTVLSLFINAFKLSLNELAVSSLYCLRWVVYAGLYFALSDLNIKFGNKSKFILAIPVVVILLAGYVQYLLYPNLGNLYYLGWDEHLYRMFGVFLDPNFAGVFFVLSLIYLISLLLQGTKIKQWKWAFLASIAGLNLIAVYLTYSRTALIALVIGILILSFYKINKRILTVVLMLLFLLVLVIPKSFKTEGTNLFRSVSIEQRIKSGEVAFSIFKDNPIFGVGFDAYRYYQKSHGYLGGQYWDVTHAGSGADNSYLFILATTGIVGFTAYLYLLYRMFLIGKAKKSNLKYFACASLAVFCVSGLFINVLFYTFLMEWIWIVFALTENS